jgi:hypothetical protein
MKKIFSEAVVLLIVIALFFSSIAIATNTRETNKNISGNSKMISYKEIEKQVATANVFQDGFESYTDFALDFPPWIQVDGDLGDTYGATDYDWVNEHSPQSFIIFNPSQTTPSWTGDPEVEPYSGEKYAACFSTVPPDTNDDWLITPKVPIQNGAFFKFWARSYTDQWGKERFRVGISTTDPVPSNFVILSTEPYIEAPVEWTEYSFDLANFVGQDAYLAINCVSADAFFLMVDDVSVTGEGGCEPGIDVEKYVLDLNGEWVDADTEDEALDLPICHDGQFKIVIKNTGECALINIVVKDIMHESLKYINADPEPDNVEHVAPDWIMDWFFPGPLAPGATIEIFVNFHVEGPECSRDYNHVIVEGFCEECPGDIVQDEDWCWVHAYKKSKDLNMPFLQFLEAHPNIFPLLQKLLKTLGL